MHPEGASNCSWGTRELSCTVTCTETVLRVRRLLVSYRPLASSQAEQTRLEGPEHIKNGRNTAGASAVPERESSCSALSHVKDSNNNKNQHWQQHYQSNKCGKHAAAALDPPLRSPGGHSAGCHTAAAAMDYHSHQNNETGRRGVRWQRRGFSVLAAFALRVI